MSLFQPWLWSSRFAYRTPRSPFPLRCDQLEERTTPSASLDTLFAASTSPAYIQSVEAGNGPTHPVANFQIQGGWSETATNPSGPLPQGRPITLTWGFVPDGLSIPGSDGEPTSPSKLIATLDSLFGVSNGSPDLTTRPWFHLFAESFARMAAVTGNTYVYESHDDGATFETSPGVLGVRPDVRISGHSIIVNGDGSILAYNFYPSESDMVINTDSLSSGGMLTNASNDYRTLRNVIMHEHGHGLGLAHEEPVAGVALMEPFVSTNFDGPQIDDILGLQRLYGDQYEKNGGNDTVATATSLGAISLGGTITIGADANTTTQYVAPNATDFVSISGTSDTDVYSFTVNSDSLISVNLLPVGPTYLSGPQNSDGSSGPTSLFNAAAQSELKFDLLDSLGNVVASQSAASLGQSVSLTNFFTRIGGTYYVRITGTQDASQFYQLILSDANATPSITATITLASSQPAVTNTGPVRFMVTFGEPVTGFTASSVLFSGGTLTTGLSATITANGTAGNSYFVDVNGLTGTGTAGIALASGAAVATDGSLTLAATTLADQLVTFDNVPPVPTVTAMAANFTGTEADFTVTFNEALQSPAGFTATSVTLGGTAHPTTVMVSATADPHIFMLAVTGMNQEGTVTVTVLPGSTADVAGNLAVGSNTASAAFHPPAPPVLPPPPTSPPPPALPPAPANLPSVFAVGAGPGDPPVVKLYTDAGTLQSSWTAFNNSPGGVRVAVGDFNGDGTPDVAVGTGPGVPALVRVLDGATGRELFRFTPFEGFTGGVFLAAGDIDGDGAADLVITPDEGGGPRVTILHGRDFTQLANFYGIDDPNFRGGARAALGDLNGDGKADLVVSAGFGGGPRISVYDGAALLAGQRVHPIPDFLMFDGSLRNGAYVAVGDLNGDGYGDIIGGAGPGGGPRVLALSGQALLSGDLSGAFAAPLANFFAGDAANRGGVRVAVKNLDGDNRADLIVGDGEEAGSRVTAYLGRNFAGSAAVPQFALDAFPGSTSGIFVG